MSGIGSSKHTKKCNYLGGFCLSEMIQAVRAYIIDNFLFGEETQLQRNTSFIREGIVDSIGIMELVDFIEQEYNIKIDDDEMVPQNLDSLAHLQTFIQRKINA